MGEDGIIITNTAAPGPDNEKLKAAKTITTVVYALQAVAFLLGITALVAVIINYVKRGDVQGTWLASHFKWQINTFWYSLLWAIIGFVLLFVFIGYLVLVANVVWVIYRIVKGWLRLVDNKPMYI